MKKTHLLLIFVLSKVAVLSLLIFGLLFLFGSCADVSQVQECLPTEEHTYGFWGGTWHGMIATPSFIGSLFSDDIAIYAINNNGGWYDFGFIGGLGFVLGIIRLAIEGKK